MYPDLLESTRVYLGLTGSTRVYPGLLVWSGLLVWFRSAGLVWSGLVIAYLNSQSYLRTDGRMGLDWIYPRPLLCLEHLAVLKTLKGSTM